MTAATIVTRVSPDTGWDFGGSPYGLEPLTIPMPESPDLHTADATACDYRLACRRLLEIAEQAEQAPRIEIDEAATELFWFRWITGHQVSFVVWRLMAQIVRGSAELPPAGARRALEQYVRGYCAMLLYSGSCPEGVYEAVIRPSMYLQHRGFSGRWAPDYRPVRRLFSRRCTEWIEVEAAADLVASLDLYELVHNGVAARLVPNGRSLLQNAAGNRQSQSKEMLSLIYDNYFMTLRDHVPRCDVVAQLLRRLVAVAQDVAVNGLYPRGLGDDERPDELRDPGVLDCENRLQGILFDVARHATGLSADQDLRCLRDLMHAGPARKAA